ncbi:MAG: hypothetical protein GXP46_05160, partial [Deferribacteres bacterium]|nr:hypothetical protein [Deferribacteres bacterium]
MTELHKTQQKAQASVPPHSGHVTQRKPKATREAYGETLLELGKRRPDIVALDADLSGSTKTAKFAKEFPDRFFNMGVAEQDMIG